MQTTSIYIYLLLPKWLQLGTHYELKESWLSSYDPGLQTQFTQTTVGGTLNLDSPLPVQETPVAC